MTFIPEETINDIRERTSIVSVISSYVNLKKAGVNYKGPCPFHAEKTPSFVVSESKKIFHCFGCAKGGNVFTFLMEHGGLSFPEAVEKLAGELGIRIPENNQTSAQKDSKRKRELFYKINKAAMLFFEKQLKNSKQAMDFLKARGLTQKTIEDYHIGYAPSGWQNIHDFFKRKNVSQNDLLEVGLIVKNENKQRVYDRFRHRIILPLFDLNKRVISFSSRVLDAKDIPKYLNSPESMVFNKRRELFGLSAGVSSISQSGVIIVEGHFDSLIPHQEGFKNVVATMGTSFTSDHTHVLKKFTDQFYILFDSDEAGKNASERSLPIFLKERISPKIIELSSQNAQQKLDPDEFILKYGKEAFEDKIKNARPLIEFVIDRWVQKTDGSTSAKAKMIENMVPYLNEMPSELEQQEAVKYLADRLQIDEKWILKPLNQSAEQMQSTSANWKQQMNRDKSTAELEVVEFFMLFPEWLAEAFQKKTLDLLGDMELKNVALWAAQAYQSKQKIDFSAVLGKIESLQLQQRLREGVLEKEAQKRSKEEWKIVYEGCLKRIKKNHLEKKEKNLLIEIQNLEKQNKNEEQKINLLKEYQQVVKEKQQYL